ncbi:MAG: DNA mismatch repair endonuclease MutL [Succinivibrio sp.]|nr:DNA mismatch repair endonuclease MutL [Succinivibrio sp.]
MSIKLLPVQLSNQIAAGEVVERPASVVKELLENALDAGAKRILLEVTGAGSELIRVRDDGCGIPADELKLALTAHATSKISSLYDLEHLTTLGFRGEALASIASVSKLTLTSRTAAAEHAFTVSVAGPQMQCTVMPAAHPVGSSVEVRELFFNTPARRRFLRSPRSELLRIKEVFIRAALTAPQVDFELISEGKQLLSVRGIDDAADESLRMARIAKLAGKAYAEQGLPVQGEHEKLQLDGILLPPPDPLESAQDEFYLFLNARPIADKLILHALREAYSEVTGRSCKVRAVLFLRCDPSEVDVNVHPRKDEVRFHDSRLIHDLLVQDLIGCLSRRLDFPQLSAAPDTPSPDDTAAAPPLTEDDFPSGVGAVAGAVAVRPPAPSPAESDSAEVFLFPDVAPHPEISTLPAEESCGTAPGAGANEAADQAHKSETATHCGSHGSRAAASGAGVGVQSGAGAVTAGLSGSSGAVSSGRDGYTLRGITAENPPDAGTVHPAGLSEVGGMNSAPGTQSSPRTDFSATSGDTLGASAAEFLDLIVPGILLLRLEHRYYLVRIAALQRLLCRRRYLRQAEQGQVECHRLIMPFKVKLSSAGTMLKEVLQPLKKLGFELRLSAGGLEYLTVPQLLHGCDLAAFTTTLLNLAATEAASLRQGECPRALAQSLGEFTHLKVPLYSELASLCAQLSDPDSLRELGSDNAKELSLESMARGMDTGDG